MQLDRRKGCMGKRRLKRHPPPLPVVIPYALAFDTETTGLSRADLVVQLGWCITDEQGIVIQRKEFILRCVRPSHPTALAVHGIPVDLTIHSTHSPAVIIDLLKADIRRIRTLGGVVLAHNAAFDVRMLHQTALACGTSFEYPPTAILCTMTALKRYLLQNPTPDCTTKLSVAYEFMDGTPELISSAHQACADSEMAAYIFLEGSRRNWWPTWTRYRGCVVRSPFSCKVY